jgi:hypothetical protein
VEVAKDRHTTAFVVGAVLGGLAGVTATLWKTPWSGAQARARIAERVEQVLFRLTGMDEMRPESAAAPTTPVLMVAETPGAATDAAAAGVAEPPMTPSPDVVQEQEEATLPLTFRGEVLSDRAPSAEPQADVVLDGPRPSTADR